MARVTSAIMKQKAPAKKQVGPKTWMLYDGNICVFDHSLEAKNEGEAALKALELLGYKITKDN